MTTPLGGVRLTRPIGTGATSSVWLAECLSSKERVALKLGRGPEERERFATEAERLLFVDSPELVSVLGVGSLDAPWTAPDGKRREAGTPFILLEWLEGQALDDAGWVAGQDRLQLALSVARDVALGLEDLHRAGSAHGDVKPSNIIVEISQGPGAEPAYAARLVDLGLVTGADEPIPQGGTPRYLPPEVLRGGAQGDGRARDLYALGLTLAELASDAVLSSSEPAEAAHRVAFAEPLSTLVRALLSPAPGARPSARWVFRRALLALRAELSEEREKARRKRAVRRAYLTTRRFDLARAARARHVKVLVGGLAGTWLKDAVRVARDLQRLRGGASDSDYELGDLDAAGRAQWLVELVGTAAAVWRTPAGPDRTLSERLVSLSEQADPESLSPAALEGLTELPKARDTTAIALRLGSGHWDAALFDVAESMLLEGTAPAGLLMPLARALRLRGELGRALALLARSEAIEARVEAAEVLRRARDPVGAREKLENLPDELAPTVRARAQATAARMLLDEGAHSEALSILAKAPELAATLEARALVEFSLGRLSDAQASADKALLVAQDDEERARGAGVLGHVLHARGDAARSLKAFSQAAEYAARAGAVVEEATYLTGVAASASDLGEIAVGLEAAQRAALLFEYLGREKDAARAVLSRASLLANAGAFQEAREAADEARLRAERAADQRCQLYARLVLADVGSPAEPSAAEHAERALAASEDALRVDRLRAFARALRYGLSIDRAAADSWASDRGVPAYARLEWWMARALSPSGPPEDARRIVDELLLLIDERATPALRGAAFAAGSALATGLADDAAGERLREASVLAGRELGERVPPALRASVLALPWASPKNEAFDARFSARQLRDVEGLVRTLGRRDRLRPLLDQVLDALVLWTGVERGLLLLRAPGGRLRPRSARNMEKADLTGLQLELSSSLAERALSEREPVVAVDATGDLPEVHRSVHALKLRSVLAVPLLARGEALGVVYLDDRVRRGAFGPRELSWVRLVATLAAVAIADARDQLLLRRAARRAERAERQLAEDLAQREAALDVAERELARERGGRATRFAYGRIVGESDALRSMLRLVDRVTASDVPVLIMGESGSGKELVARAIHENGPRAKRAFVTENCGAIPEPLLESTLFGHVRGAFTGALRPRAGLFEIADGGSLFLDEIAEMSLGMQTKLLRVLEDGVLRPVGSERERRVDVRVLGATHADLRELVRTGRFREDLYYRLNVVTIHVPSLRERAGDLPLLIRHFVERHAAGRKARLSKAALSALSSYEWPGNVRQLENEVRRALVLSDGLVDLDHLSPEVRGQARPASVDRGLHVRTRVDALETELLETALRRTKGNQTRAAVLLGLSRYGLQKMMKRLGVETPSSLHSEGVELSEGR